MAEIKKYLDNVALGTLVENIKAEDAKVLTAAKSHAEGLGVNYDAAGTAATKVQELANGAVATNAAGIAENKAAITKLNGDATTEGSVAKAIADAKAVIDADIDAVEAIANKNKEDIAAINNAENGILAQANAYTDGKASEVQGNVDTLAETVADLDTYVGDIPEGYTETNVIAYINKKAQETLDSASGGSSESAASVLAALNTYKSENDPKVAKNTEDIATAQAAADAAQEHSEGVAADLAEAVEALESADAGQVERIAALEGQITGLSGAMHFKGVIETDPTTITSGYDNGDTVIYGNKEYVFNNGAFVEFGDVSAQAEAITGLTDRMGVAEGNIATLEGEMDDAQAAIELKAEKTYVDEKVEALQGVDTTQNEKIAALEAKFGGAEGSVEDMIADAKAEAISEAGTAADTKDEAVLASAKSYTDSEIDKVEETVATLTETVNTKAAQSEVNTISGKVGTLETDMAQAKTDIDAVELKAANNETAIGNLQTAVNGKAAQTDLDNAVARIAQNETDISALQDAAETHALASDLTAAVERIAANETAIANNTSAIAAFTVITSEEVNTLFA